MQVAKPGTSEFISRRNAELCESQLTLQGSVVYNGCFNEIYILEVLKLWLTPPPAKFAKLNRFKFDYYLDGDN